MCFPRLHRQIQTSGQSLTEINVLYPQFLHIEFNKHGQVDFPVSTSNFYKDCQFFYEQQVFSLRGLNVLSTFPQTNSNIRLVP